MARKGLLETNERKKNLIARASSKRFEIKKKLKDKNLGWAERIQLTFKLDKMPANSSKVRYRNRCSLTGRPRGYYRDFGLARVMMRELICYGELPGVKKSSW